MGDKVASESGNTEEKTEFSVGLEEWDKGELFPGLIGRNVERRVGLRVTVRKKRFEGDGFGEGRELGC
jgi:hypothetical protein